MSASDLKAEGFEPTRKRTPTLKQSHRHGHRHKVTHRHRRALPSLLRPNRVPLSGGILALLGKHPLQFNFTGAKPPGFQSEVLNHTDGCLFSSARVVFWLHNGCLGRTLGCKWSSQAATRFWSFITVGSSPKTSSPTSACAMAWRMPSKGAVTVSERMSTVASGACTSPLG